VYVIVVYNSLAGVYTIRGKLWA